MKKCKWCDEDYECELRDGISDDSSCDGNEEEMYECGYVQNNATYDGVEIEDIVKRWIK